MPAFSKPSIPSTSTPSSSSKGGLLKRFATKIRPSTANSTASQDAPTTPAASSTPSVSKPKRKATIIMLPPVPRPKAPTLAFANGFTSQEQRDAALLARGLVPPRYRDRRGDTIPMSEQERRMDNRFSVVVEEPRSSAESSSEGESEAKRIREAWLKRNAAAAATAHDDPDNARALPTIDDEDVMIFKSRSPQRPNIVAEHAVPLLSPSQAELRSGTSEFGEIECVDPATIPLPPTPKSTRAARSKVGDDDVPPLPGTLGESRSPSAPLSPRGSIKTAPAIDASQSTRVADARKDKSAPSSISLSVSSASSPHSQHSTLPPLPSPETDFHRARSATLPTLHITSSTPPPIQRGRSLGGKSTSSRSVPALSPTRTVDSVTTSDAPHTPTMATSVSRMRQSSISGESGSSEDKSRVADVIVECSEDGNEHVAELQSTPKPLVAIPEKPVVERKRTGLFGMRNASAGNAKIARSATSMSNLRRSVTNKLNIARPKSALVVDTSVVNTPSKATSPSSAASPPSSFKSPGGLVAGPRRTPISPTMHSRGSILLCAKEIEDEESRRLSEAAFLDF